MGTAYQLVEVTRAEPHLPPVEAMRAEQAADAVGRGSATRAPKAAAKSPPGCRP